MKKYLKILLVLHSTFFIQHSAFAQSWLWGSYGKALLYNVQGNSVSTNANGDCFFTGYLYEDTVIFGLDSLISSTHNVGNEFLIKYDRQGKLIWAKQSFSTSSYGGANGYIVSADGFGNAYITANFSDSIIFGLDTLNGAGGSYLVKYDSNGDVLWAKQSVGINSPYAGAVSNYVVADNSGNAYIVGGVYGTVKFGSDTLSTPNYKRGSQFIAKYAPNGNVIWAKQTGSFATGGADYQYAATDIHGNIFITGYFTDTATIDTFNLYELSNIGGSFLVKYDSSGKVLWAVQSEAPNGSCYAQARSVTTDILGNSYITGLFNETIIFGKDTLINKTHGNCTFLVKYSPSGDVLWAKQSTTLDNNDWGPTTLSSDNAKHIYLSGGGGESTCSFKFGNITLNLYDTGHDVASFLIEFDSNGNAICGSIIPGGGFYWNSVTSDTSGKYVYFGSSTFATEIFGKDTIRPFVPDRKNEYFPFVARWVSCEDSILLGEKDLKVENESEKLKVYPNPNNGMCTISLSDIPQQSHVELYNMLGERVKSEELRMNNTEIDLSGQLEGVYLYRVVNESGGLVGSGKFVIER